MLGSIRPRRETDPARLPGAPSSQPQPNAVPDVFISYARSELPFVRRLCTGLETANLRPWVDVDGLYGGEQFWPEICRAIEAAAAFVFVMTPDSVISTFCLRELAHAQGSHKRIVPVCRGAVVASAVPDAIASQQWIFFRDNDPVEPALAEVVAAVRADWTWRRAQARLLVRATEWHARGRDTASMLRGATLEDAERWIAESDGRPNGPTAVQRDFVRMSREYARRRRRRLLLVTAATVVALCGATGIAVREYIQTRNAVAENARVSAADVLDKLDLADTMCRMLPVYKTCVSVGLHIAYAYDRENQRPQAIERLSQLISRLERHAGTDPGLLDSLADAHQSRAAILTFVAETDDDTTARDRRYDLAERDMDDASRIRERVPLAANRVPLAVTRARVLIGRARYAEAVRELSTLSLPELSRISPDAPFDVELLLAAAYNCQRDARGLATFAQYINGLDGRQRDPHWLRNEPYFTAIGKQCASHSQ